jgi:hypothetical protein
MSHYFDSPTGREDPRLNLCDLFVFAGPEATTVLVMTVNPDAGLSSPTELRDGGLCEFNIDTDGDAREDVLFRLVVIDLGGERQRVEVRREEGEASRTGTGGRRLGSGVTDEVFALEGGGRALFGIAADPFIGNGPALQAFVREFRGHHTELPRSSGRRSPGPPDRIPAVRGAAIGIGAATLGRWGGSERLTIADARNNTCGQLWSCSTSRRSDRTRQDSPALRACLQRFTLVLHTGHTSPTRQRGDWRPLSPRWRVGLV